MRSAGASGRSGSFAVDDERHRLLGQPAMRAQRLVERREIVRCALVPIILFSPEIITMSPMRSAGSSKRAQASSRSSTSVDALDRRAAAP